jgi:hypothetical protein
MKNKEEKQPILKELQLLTVHFSIFFLFKPKIYPVAPCDSDVFKGRRFNDSAWNRCSGDAEGSY